MYEQIYFNLRGILYLLKNVLKLMGTNQLSNVQGFNHYSQCFFRKLIFKKNEKCFDSKITIYYNH